MAEIINNLKGKFIATVVGYNIDTRELDVFIPKLMPGIPDGQENIDIKTNLGNNSITVKHSEKITTGSSIRVKAEDVNEPIPNIDSKVSVYFLDGQYRWGFWTKFNPNGDYEVIEEEKYEDLYYLKIGEKEILIENEDKVNIELPPGFNVILIDDKATKTKTFKISQDDELVGRVTDLEKIVGNDDMIQRFEDNDGNPKEQFILASGLYKRLKKTNSRIDDLISIIGTSGIDYEYIEQSDNRFEVSKKYFVLTNNDYYEIDLSEFKSKAEKEKCLQDILSQGMKLYTRKEIQGDASGLYARIEAIEKKLSIK